MIIVDNKFTFQVKDNNIFERSYNMRGTDRRAIVINLPEQDGVDYETLSKIFSDNVKIINREIGSHFEDRVVKEETEDEPAEIETVEVEDVKDYDLSSFCVAGDIVDKRDGSFVVYMGQKTDTEILNEEMAELLLEMGGIE